VADAGEEAPFVPASARGARLASAKRSAKKRSASQMGVVVPAFDLTPRRDGSDTAAHGVKSAAAGIDRAATLTASRARDETCWPNDGIAASRGVAVTRLRKHTCCSFPLSFL
jgi:hypothetical protein